ncbi:MAG: hypothetical protein CMJ49_05575 [Planctomycetaceae bacterium]|nr:hypothetical protein [Planctomycetaceae bacterium]
MPIQLNDVDVIPEVAGLTSALIVPCNMCPAVTVAARQQKPFMRLLRSCLKSIPFDQHIKGLQSRLQEKGLTTSVFRSRLYHHWFLCMWTNRKRKKLRKRAKQVDAVIVLGCDSATETVRDAVDSTDTKVIQGMEIVGMMNAKLTFHWPCSISFEDGKVIPIAQPEST